MPRNVYRRPHRLHRSRSIPRWMEYTSYAGVIIGLLLIGIVCYFEYVAQDYTVASDATEIVFAEEEEDAPDTAPTVDDGADPALTAQPVPPGQAEDVQPDDDDLFSDGPAVVQGFIEQGDTAGGILQEWLTASEVATLVNASKSVYPLNRLKLGQAYTVYFDNRELNRFEYEISNDSKLIITRSQAAEGKAAWSAKLEGVEFEVRLALIQGKVKTTLPKAMVAAGEKASLASRLSQVFAWEVNFLRDVRPGDRFRILTEKRYRHGVFEGYGRMPAVEFINRHSKYEAYAFTDGSGNATYFNAAGESLKRAFLKAPLSYSRISSRFSLARLHPILKTVRPHPGVDYAAPKGTPVKAIGQGAITYRGYDRGAGNFITMKHHNGYESMYLHLSGFAQGLKIGDRVQQGQVIGYVGSTGYSTGPHLDFRMKKNGQFINPEKMLAERDVAVPQKRLAAFKAERDKWRRYMSGKMPLSEYDHQKAKFK